MLIDTHVHLNADQYDEDLEQVIENAREAGVDRMFVVGFDTKTVERTMELIDQYDFIYGIIGWHPVDAIDCTDERLEWIEDLSKHEKIIGIGEMGLDYHWDKSPKDVQKEVFRKQIALAKRVQLPIVIHNREATQDCVDILMEEHAEEVGGIMHSFSGSPEIADVLFNKLDFHISLGGPVTFKNAKQPKEVAKHVPLERLLVETDAPFLSPHPYRGKRNEPSRVTLVAEQIAELRGISYEEVCKVTTENAERLFKLK
ncbi:TatD family hydrolase [Staphylococcus massiliensis]|uniref:TatD family deoxyribonuclease n=1 Tax=Staphylococcus massiliensis S46 TaxID=1229783 RepID=K9AU70_9STAP|nr:TatD family hydrolase [Staphylococcus massiliensis]EKU46147.1 TatD family deoxyribonuclease [Staphylococcus massiliensis S46]MCG3400528.1 TatD family hydrolase [Staphylococcus massiliensis]MCG3402814.1 TatD family hydrolase [Staphylococcus massiliensis]MCG3413211.1 TatD family hydrolase [Staphylococcus massiliensis]POA01962.1 TatD family deoxyribonuclease [Staphylococcus massiliensis CCUG 55927]